jgi:hypothetical protein
VDLDCFRRPAPARRNKVDALLDAIAANDPDLAGIVRQALEGDPAEFPTRTIAKVLTRNGWHVADTAISNWRRINCA